MNNKFWKILIPMLLLLGVLLTGCKGNGDPVDTTPNTDYADDEDDGYVKDQIPSSLKYGGEEFTVLHWISEVTEFGCNSYTGDLVNDACYERDLTVQERLNVTLNFQEEPGGSDQGQVDRFCAKVQNASAAGDYFDLIATYGRTAATLSYQGYLADMLDIEYSYLNFENPWWSSGLLEELRVGEALFLASGDISTTIVQMSQGIFYNVDMLESYQLTDPYEHVKNNTWTMETFYTYLESINATPDSGTGYAYVSNYWSIASLFHGCDVPLMTIDADGYPTMNPDLYGEKAVGIMDKLGEYAAKENFLVASEDDATFRPFYEGNALFVNTSIGNSRLWTQNATFKYNIVPTPKYNADQAEYITTLRNSITVYSMMSGQSQAMLTKLSAIMECMASEGYRKTTPAIYNDCLLSRYVNVVQMPEMLELIHSTVTYDFGRIYSMKQTNYLCDRIGRIIQQDPARSEYGKTWTSFGNSEGGSTAAQFQLIVDNLKALA